MASIRENNEAKRRIEIAKNLAMKSFVEIANEEWNKATKILYDEALNMFKEIIKQYYRYETERYIRHGQDSPGTCTGINLYRAGDENHIKRIHGSYSGFSLDTIELDINSLGMDDYINKRKNDEILTIEASYVWSIVSGDEDGVGMRGIPNSNFYIPWSFEYNGKIFQIKGNNINNAFKEFEEELLNNTLSLCLENIKEKWKKRMLKFKETYDRNMDIIRNN